MQTPNTLADDLASAHRGAPTGPGTAAGPADYAAAMRIQFDVARKLGATLAG